MPGASVSTGAVQPLWRLLLLSRARVRRGRVSHIENLLTTPRHRASLCRVVASYFFMRMPRMPGGSRRAGSPAETRSACTRGGSRRRLEQWPVDLRGSRRRCRCGPRRADRRRWRCGTTRSRTVRRCRRGSAGHRTARFQWAAGRNSSAGGVRTPSSLVGRADPGWDGCSGLRRGGLLGAVVTTGAVGAVGRRRTCVGAGGVDARPPFAGRGGAWDAGVAAADGAAEEVAEGLPTVRHRRGRGLCRSVRARRCRWSERKPGL